ncbi:cytochrome P450 3A24 [Exaiptasia diaphana]|uniref:Cytochrome P450 n=1 Tax=Exaiptasia diaphana TaxID=2652724 RepID=A0A913XRG9_EXADI|nr:cytochrome P450 3A24 [Exaiptasia diaphana]KXJ25206.1 Cytochrome P450 3A24 [Exaiptasia diaphana]
MNHFMTSFGEFSSIIYTILGLMFVVMFYRFGTRKRRLLEDAFPGMTGPKPMFLFGHTVDLIKAKGQIHEHFDVYYKKYGQLFALSFFGSPALVVSDPEMIKDICVKNFDCFYERTTKFTMPKPLDRALNIAHGETWKRIRNTLSPSFSAHKLKGMTSLINLICDKLMERIDKVAASGKSVDIVSYQQTATLDAIMSIAFGVQTDFQNNPNDPIMQKAIRAMKPSALNITMQNIILPYLPYGRKLPTSQFGSHFFFKDILEFVDLAQSVLDERRKLGKDTYKDFLDLMINATNPEEPDNHKLSDDDIIAQCVIFLLAGYETSSTTLALTCYYLAAKPEIQEKVQQEIDRVWPDEEEVPTYDAINDLHYLDMVISETLRLCPPGLMLMRECTKPCIVKGIKIPKDCPILVPAYSIHRDPKIYPEPETFDPERFSAEGKLSRDPYSYLPFGHGPRNCIGMRFSRMEMKMMLARLLKRISLSMTPETKKPKLVSKATLTVDGSIFLGVEKRVK